MSPVPHKVLSLTLLEETINKNIKSGEANLVSPLFHFKSRINSLGITELLYDKAKIKVHILAIAQEPKKLTICLFRRFYNRVNRVIFRI